MYSGEGAVVVDGEGDEDDEDDEDDDDAAARQLARTLAEQEARTEADAVLKGLDSVFDAGKCLSFQIGALCSRLDEWAQRSAFFHQEVQLMRAELYKARQLIPVSHKRRKIQ